MEEGGFISLVIVLMMPAIETIKPPPLPSSPSCSRRQPNKKIFYLIKLSGFVVIYLHAFSIVVLIDKLSVLQFVFNCRQEVCLFLCLLIQTIQRVNSLTAGRIEINSLYTRDFSGEPKENIVQNYIKIALLNIFQYLNGRSKHIFIP